MTKTRKKLLIASLITMLSLNGCSINSQKDTTNKKNKTIICEETSTPLTQNYYDYLEDIYQMNYIENEKIEKNIIFEYLIDFTGLNDNSIDNLYKSMNKAPLNKATFAHLIEDSTITNITKPFDGKTAMTNATFYSDGSSKVYQPIIIPESYNNTNILDFIGKEHLDGESSYCDLNCKKFITIDGQTLYYLDGKVGDGENNIFNAQALYQYTDNHEFVLLYRNQTGYGLYDRNILDSNFNNVDKIVYPIEETVFKDLNGTYEESYLREALDVYSSENNYYSSDNEGKDFSMYKKITN